MMVKFAGLNEDGQVYDGEYTRSRQLIDSVSMKRGILEVDSNGSKTCVCDDVEAIKDCINEAMQDSTMVHEFFPVDDTQLLVGLFTNEEARETHREKILRDAEHFKAMNQLMRMLSA